MNQVRRWVTAPLAWGLSAVVIATMLQIAHVREVGSLEATLRVGVDSEALPYIEDDFGHAIPVTAGEGHDGWRFYLTASDPLALDAQRRLIYWAYRFRRVVGPLIAGAGGRVLFAGRVSASVISPEGEEWDDAVLVEYPSRDAFLKMISSPEYQSAAPHRTAALLDSRLIATHSLMSSLAE